MATILVPSDKSTIQDAINVASPGDSIIVEVSYLGPETATVTVNSLKIEVSNPTININLILDNSITDIIVNGDADVDISGGSLGTNIYGNDGNNKITSEEGDDVVVGGQGNDTLDGGKGDDNLQGGNDNDEISGSDGNDTLFGSNGQDSLFGGDDNDSLNGGANNDYLDGGVGSDTILGGSGNDTIVGNNASSGAGASDISGGSGNDVIVTRFGSNHVVNGDSGDDEIGFRKLALGFSGSISTGNSFDGGADTDTFQIEDFSQGTGTFSDDVFIIDLTGGVVGRDNGTGTFTTYGTVANFENIKGSNGLDSLLGDGGDNVILGNDGNDTIFGGAGNDTLSGGDNDDLIIGGGPLDTSSSLLQGDAGNDVLLTVSATGNNTVEGGAGND